MSKRALESSRHPPVPSIAFSLPVDGPFALLFISTMSVVPSREEPSEDPPKEPPKPTATDAHTTGHDGANPNPFDNEDLDWENDD